MLCRHASASSRCLTNRLTHLIFDKLTWVKWMQAIGTRYWTSIYYWKQKQRMHRLSNGISSQATAALAALKSTFVPPPLPIPLAVFMRSWDVSVYYVNASGPVSSASADRHRVTGLGIKYETRDTLSIKSEALYTHTGADRERHRVGRGHHAVFLLPAVYGSFAARGGAAARNWGGRRRPTPPPTTFLQSASQPASQPWTASTTPHLSTSLFSD